MSWIKSIMEYLIDIFVIMEFGNGLWFGKFEIVK